MDRRYVLYFALVVSLLLNETRGTAIPETESDQTCNTCCQGAGIPGSNGMPGSPGNNGLPGRDGTAGRDGLPGRDGVNIKGDAGSKGDKGEMGVGERGPMGPQGPSGERGDSGERGQSGVNGPSGKVGPTGPVGPVGHVGPAGSAGPVGPVGPVGPAGPAGPVGPAGRNGEKGTKGESGLQRQSAFSVQKTGNQVAAADHEIITFDTARVNVGGHFDLNTNRFVCQIPGVYLFTYSVYGTETKADENPDIQLLRDGNILASARSEPANTQVSSTTMVSLEEGNQVYLRFVNGGEGVSIGSDKGCQFSGFLLYEQM